MFFSGTVTVAAQKVLVVLPKDDWTRKQIILVVTKDNIFMYKILPFLLPCIRSIQELIWKNLAILVTSSSVILWCSKTNIRHIRYFVKYTWCICADLFYLLSSIYILLSVPNWDWLPKGWDVWWEHWSEASQISLEAVSVSHQESGTVETFFQEGNRCCFALVKYLTPVPS